MARLQANVRIRANGDYEKRFTMDGKRYSVYGKTQKEVLEKEQELREKIKSGMYVENKKITLDKYYEEWVEVKRKSVKPASIRTYSMTYRNHISPILGSKKIRDIERRDVLRTLMTAGEILSPRAANMVLMVINVILNDAVRDEIIPRNPASTVKRIKDAGDSTTKTKHRALTVQEQESFMGALNGKYYYEFIAFMISTGMRQGEVAALSWSDVDMKNNVIHVRKTLTRTEDGKRTIGDPKTKNGGRDIPITDNIIAILKSVKEKENNNVVRIDGTIFRKSNGGLIFEFDVNRCIKNTLEELDGIGVHIEPFTSHALRDTFATRFIEQGGNPQTLKVILGHSSLAMTMDLYAQVLPDAKQEEMKKVNIII